MRDNGEFIKDLLVLALIVLGILCATKYIWGWPA